MKKPTFTPGPWRPRHGHRTVTPRGIYAGGKPVVRFNGLAAPTSKEGRANAHLIAAAPDMYAVLAEVSARIEMGPYPDGLRVWVTDVLAKARGEQ